MNTERGILYKQETSESIFLSRQSTFELLLVAPHPKKKKKNRPNNLRIQPAMR